MQKNETEDIDMKKTYATPVAEKIEFRYNEQVAATSGLTCTQVWLGYGDGLTSGCSHTVQVPDSGF